MQAIISSRRDGDSSCNSSGGHGEELRAVQSEVGVLHHIDAVAQHGPAVYGPWRGVDARQIAFKAGSYIRNRRFVRGAWVRGKRRRGKLDWNFCEICVLRKREIGVASGDNCVGIIPTGARIRIVPLVHYHEEVRGEARTKINREFPAAGDETGVVDQFIVIVDPQVVRNAVKVVIDYQSTGIICESNDVRNRLVTAG